MAMEYDLNRYLKIMVENEASDLYFTAGAPPCLKIHGRLNQVGKQSLTAQECEDIANETMNDEQQVEFKCVPEMNLALSREKIGRFRVNIFKQRGAVGLVIRHIKTDIPDPMTLGLPPILSKLIMQKNGLILFVGATASGKSTTMASMIDYRNTRVGGHIITIEDPIEYVHEHKQSLVNQREVGVDTLEYSDALKNTLRQSPDVILIGEIRTRDTMDYAITFSETGHLCISTLHATNTSQALDRIINFFPEDRRNQLLLDLSLNLVAFISQRLIPSLDGKRVLATEVLLGTPTVKDLIYRGEIASLRQIMEQSENLGMHSFDSDIFRLYEQEKISYEEALRNADSPNNLRLRIGLSQGDVGEAGDSLSLKEEFDDRGSFLGESMPDIKDDDNSH